AARPVSGRHARLDAPLPVFGDVSGTKPCGTVRQRQATPPPRDPSVAGRMRHDARMVTTNRSRRVLIQRTGRAGVGLCPPVGANKSYFIHRDRRASASWTHRGLGAWGLVAVPVSRWG